MRFMLAMLLDMPLHHAIEQDIVLVAKHFAPIKTCAFSFNSTCIINLHLGKPMDCLILFIAIAKRRRG